MSLLPTATTRQPLTPSLNTGAQSGAKAAGQQAGSAAAANATSGASGVSASSATPVSLSQGGLDLSAQGLAARAETLGENTVDFAQNFVSSFTQQFFGDAGKGATISFDSASIESEAGFAAGVEHSQDASGTTDSAALSVNESAHFIGKGTITTADGHTYQFEVEVEYSASADVAASSTSSAASAADDSASSAPASSLPSSSSPAPAASDGTSSGDTASLPTLQLPAIDFAGSLSDLFKLLGNKLQTAVPAQSGSANGSGSATDASNNTSSSDPAGTLSLKLLKLLQQDFKTDNTPATSPSATSAQSAARAYASQSATASASAGATSAQATPSATGTGAAAATATPSDTLPPAA